MILGKDRNVAWRNFDTVSARMGINREMIRTMVKENKEGKIQMEELIDPTLVILSDITKENPQMDVLNNAKNSVVDSYQTTKWIFHEIQELKYRVSSLERENSSLQNKKIEEEKDMDNRMEEVKSRVQTMEGSMQNIVEQSYNILKEANENIKVLINKIEEHRVNKEDDHSPNSAKDRSPEDGLRKRTKSNTKKKDIQEPDKDLFNMKEAVGRMSKLEI